MSPPEGPLRVVPADSLLVPTPLAEAEAAGPASLPPSAPPPPRRSITVELDYPIQAHGETVKQLTFRPPKTRELREVDALGKGLNTECIAGLIVRLAGIPMSSVDQLDPIDFFSIANALAPFFRKPDPTS
jgi:hypothetical protein